MKTETQIKHTPGPWSWGPQGELMGGADGKRIHIGQIHTHYADLNLIAEAGTVAEETGLTPRQLNEQRLEMLEALKEWERDLIVDKEYAEHFLFRCLPDDEPEYRNKRDYCKRRLALIQPLIAKAEGRS